MLIPYDQFGKDGPLIHFGHANGYPPLAYRELLEGLADSHQILAMRMRPLWPDSIPSQLNDWRPLASDLQDFFRQHNLGQLVGVGHSMGATTALRLALQSPQTFSALVLIDPVLFPPAVILAMCLIHSLGLSYRLHPLASSALRRRRVFSSPIEMYKNYRNKPVFSRVDDSVLGDYVYALARRRPDGQVELGYPPEWEARIYVTGVLADMEIWRQLPSLQPPLLLLRGQDSDTFRQGALRLLRRKLPAAQVEQVPNTTHLLPLEKPGQVSSIIQRYLRSL